MKRMIVCLAVVGAAAAPTAGQAKTTGEGTRCVLHARMSAVHETTGSTSTAKGHTLVKIRKSGTIQFKTQINNKQRETFVAGHIHQAPAGVAGPVVVPLFVSPASPTSARHIKQSGTATPNAGTTAADLCRNPSTYYVNYHTTAFPAG